MGSDAAGRQITFAWCICVAAGHCVSEHGGPGAGSARGAPREAKGSGCCAGCGKAAPAVGGPCKARGALPVKLPPLDLAQHQRSDVCFQYIVKSHYVISFFLVDEEGCFDFRKEFPLSSGATPIPIFPCQFLWLRNLSPLFYQ